MSVTYLTAEDGEVIGQELDKVAGRIADIEQEVSKLMDKLKEKSKKE